MSASAKACVVALAPISLDRRARGSILFRRFRPDFGWAGIVQRHSIYLARYRTQTRVYAKTVAERNFARGKAIENCIRNPFIAGRYRSQINIQLGYVACSCCSRTSERAPLAAARAGIIPLIGDL